MWNDPTLIISEVTKGLYTLTTHTTLVDNYRFKKDIYYDRNHRTYHAYVKRIGFWRVTSISLDGHMTNPVEKVTRGIRHFNNFIREVELIDLPLSNGLYTWSNNRPPPTLIAINRFLTTKDLLGKFSNADVQRLNRPTSKHYPILLSMGC